MQLLSFLVLDFEIIKVLATDKDQENHDNSDLRYTIVSQDPELPRDGLFVMNEITGAIRVNAGGLDREVRLGKLLLQVASDS